MSMYTMLGDHEENVISMGEKNQMTTNRSNERSLAEIESEQAQIDAKIAQEAEKAAKERAELVKHSGATLEQLMDGLDMPEWFIKSTALLMPAKDGKDEQKIVIGDLSVDTQTIMWSELLNTVYAGFTPQTSADLSESARRAFFLGGPQEKRDIFLESAVQWDYDVQRLRKTAEQAQSAVGSAFEDMAKDALAIVTEKHNASVKIMRSCATEWQSALTTAIKQYGTLKYLEERLPTGDSMKDLLVYAKDRGTSAFSVVYWITEENGVLVAHHEIAVGDYRNSGFKDAKVVGTTMSRVGSGSSSRDGASNAQIKEAEVKYGRHEEYEALRFNSEGAFVKYCQKHGISVPVAPVWVTSAKIDYPMQNGVAISLIKLIGATDVFDMAQKVLGVNSRPNFANFCRSAGIALG